ncbi:hypothetical protein PL11201_690152 [Planktothrix sp. PCC 11201]|nr:hypothetical protein PL11201_690152 [Planktothrix sp. PCC 11201]
MLDELEIGECSQGVRLFHAIYILLGLVQLFYSFSDQTGFE